MASKKSKSKKAPKAASKKETGLALNLLRSAWGCEPESCQTVKGCAILCETLKCGKLHDVAVPHEHLTHLAWPCPTQIVCRPVECGTVTCGSLKSG